MLLLIASACYLAMASHIPERLREMNWLGLEGSILLLPLHVAVSTTAAALFAGAILARVHASEPTPTGSYALQYFTPLVAFYGILITALHALALAPYLLLRVVPSMSGSAETIYEGCALLRAMLPAFLLFMPVLIVRERRGLLEAASQNLTLWRHRPAQILGAIAIFAALALAVQSSVALVLAPVSRSWLVVAALRQWMELVLHVLVLIAATRLIAAWQPRLNPQDGP